MIHETYISHPCTLGRLYLREMYDRTTNMTELDENQKIVWRYFFHQPSDVGHFRNYSTMLQLRDLE